MEAPQAKKIGYFDGRRRQKTGILERAAGEKKTGILAIWKISVSNPPGGWGGGGVRILAE